VGNHRRRELMPRMTTQTLPFKSPDADDGQRARRALELILGQDVSQEDATDNVAVDRDGEDV